MRTSLKFILIITLSLLFTACSFTFSDFNKRQYNDLSRKHNEVANQALIKKNEAVDGYNDSKYEEAKEAARQAKDLFVRAKEISTENEKNAAKIKDISWLSDYQQKVVTSEAYWIEMMDIVVKACDAQMQNNLTAANKLVKELEAKVPQYEALQKEIDEIEANHKDFFEGN